ELAMAKAAIDYGSYIHMEEYPFAHKRKTGEDAFHDLDGDFYTYRHNVDLSNRDLFYYRPYFDFMKMHFGNLSYMGCLENCKNEIPRSERRLHFNEHKIALVDSLVRAKDLRDVLFRSFALDYLIKEERTNQESIAILEDFEAQPADAVHIEEKAPVSLAVSVLLPGMAVPDSSDRDSEFRQDALNTVVIASDQGRSALYACSTSQP